MNYEATSIREVTQEFEEANRSVLLEQISKYRKMINSLSFNINEAIKDLDRKHSDGTIAKDHLENAINRAKYFETSEMFNTDFKKEGDYRFDNPENLSKEDISIKMSSLGHGPNRNKRYNILFEYSTETISKQEWIKKYCK